MNETLTTVRGTIITHPTTRRVGEDPVFSFRVACNSRYQDRLTGEWRNGSTLYLGASCWGKLAEQAGGRLVKGDHVIMQGRLVSNEYERDGVPSRDTEMRVAAMGPDMSRMEVTARRLRRPEAADGAPGETASEGTPDGAADAPAEGAGQGDDDEAGAPVDVSGLEEASGGDLVGAGSGSGERGGSGAPF